LPQDTFNLAFSNRKMKTSATTNLGSLLKKRWVKICGAVLGLLVLGFLLLPVGVKYYLTDWLVKNGADSATIEKLRYNPFLGRITLEGVEVQAGGQSILHNSSMVLDVGITSLIRRDIHLERAEYRDLVIDLEQYEDGRWRFGSYTMAGDSSETVVETKEEVASAWAILADSVVLHNCSVHLKMTDLEMTLAIEQAALNKFTTRGGKPAGTFSFKGKLDDGPVAIELDTLQLVPAVRLGGVVSISKFDLDELSRLLQDVLPTFVGVAGIDGKILFSMETEKGLQVDYDGIIDVAGPDIGNSGFGTKAGNLKWQGRVQYSGPDNGPIAIVTNGLLAATTFALEVPGADLSIEESRIDFTGKTTVTIAENVAVENDGALLVEGVKLQMPSYHIGEESLLWKGNVLYDSDHQGEGLLVQTAGTLDLGVFQFESGKPPETIATGGNMASWQGEVVFGQKNSGDTSVLELDGTLLGGTLHAALVEPPIRIGQEKVQLKTKSIISFGEEIDIAGNSSFGLEQFKLFEGETENPLVAFDKLTVAELVGGGGRNITIKEMLTVGLKALVAGNFPLSIDVPEFQMADVVTDDLATFHAGELSLKKPLVTAVHNNGELLRFEDLAVKKITVGADGNARAENIHLGKLAFLRSGDDPAKKTVLSLGSADLSKISWSGETGLQGDTLFFNDLVTTVIRDKEAHINISRRLGDMQPAGTGPEAEPVETAAEAEGSPGIAIRLREIAVGGNSAVYFEDYTLAVPYITDLAISELKISDLDSTDPEKETNVLLTGKLEKRAPLEITGWLSPFKEKMAMNMKLNLKNYPLSSLSAYTVQSVGTALASGQLRLKTKLKLADDELDMKNSILLQKLETETISPELAAELNNELPIPLDSALSLLRDKDKNISLEIPLSGQLSDLNVGIADILITSLSKAIVPAASGYLMYTLGPYGALAYVGMKVGEKMLAVTLPPVVFVPQQKELTEEHFNYLERVAKIMKDRPDPDFQLCPRVASWEFLSEQEKAAIEGELVAVDEKSRNALLELGQQRAIAVQGHLVDKYSIDSNRLLICDTVIEEEKNAVPAVLPQL
jgi:hypothetical protein